MTVLSGVGSAWVSDCVAVVSLWCGVWAEVMFIIVITGVECLQISGVSARRTSGPWSSQFLLCVAADVRRRRTWKWNYVTSRFTVDQRCWVSSSGAWDRLKVAVDAVHWYTIVSCTRSHRRRVYTAVYSTHSYSACNSQHAGHNNGMWTTTEYRRINQSVNQLINIRLIKSMSERKLIQYGILIKMCYIKQEAKLSLG